MQEEIKFRAWDKKNKQMTKDFAVFADGRGAGAYDPVSSSGDEVYSDYELMQFTGLKDKNGKEIWEGDIINWPGKRNKGISEKAYRYEVVFKNGCFGYYLGPDFQNDLDEIVKRYEVIGNIYENPELLKNIK